ncbi:MAG: DUF5697 family protein [Firmicutes bacterium]|nr:DUF5697 family protein [Bacillota bacterium]
MNAYQKYIDSLVTEYGPLLSRQLCALVNKEFETALPNIDGYANQLCQFADFDDSLIENETAIGKKGEIANIDMIRAVDVMLEFGNDVEYFKKGCYPAVLWFLVNTKEHTKEICVVAIHEGEDINTLTQFEDDDEDNIKCSMTIFLLENKKQMSKFTKMKNIRFAVVGKTGVKFYKK